MYSAIIFYYSIQNTSCREQWAGRLIKMCHIAVFMTVASMMIFSRFCHKQCLLTKCHQKQPNVMRSILEACVVISANLLTQSSPQASVIPIPINRFHPVVADEKLTPSFLSLIMALLLSLVNANSILK